MKRWLLAGSLLLLTSCFAPGTYDSRSYEQARPDRVIIDRPGKCETRCTWLQSIGQYSCRDYRC
jgi:hypothetical protein